MTAGETLLKITDYPFAYSFVVILGSILGFSITQNKFYLLGIAGTLGTFLTIIDPVGRYVRYRLEQRIQKTKVESETEPDYEHQKSAIGSKAIGMEIDQIVGLIYFAITLVLFVIGMALPISELANNFVIVNKHQEIVCNSLCIKGYSVGGSLPVAFILGEVGRRRWSELDKKLKTAGMHQLSIENESATQNSVENMTRAIDQCDWTTADKWASKIKDEIKYKKGKKDIIIKGIEKAYRPLHKESLLMEDRCNQVATGRPYSYLEINEWQKIQLESNYIFLEDKELLHRISEFYGIIQNYDYLLGVCNKNINEIILKRASEEFGKKIQRIEYFTDKDGGDTYFRLMDCAMLGVHPKDKYQGVPAYVDINYIDDDKNSKNYKTPPTELKIFDTIWEKVLSDVEKNESVIKMKQLFQTIQNENIELKQKYLEKIAEEANL